MPRVGRRVELVPAPWVPVVLAGGGGHRDLGRAWRCRPLALRSAGLFHPQVLSAPHMSVLGRSRAGCQPANPSVGTQADPPFSWATCRGPGLEVASPGRPHLVLWAFLGAHPPLWVLQAILSFM